MNPPVSRGTLRRIARVFPAARWDAMASLLATECTDRLPLSDRLEPTDFERVHFAVLKLSGGSEERFVRAVELARTDWRDALVAADFADDVNAHLSWLADD